MFKIAIFKGLEKNDFRILKGIEIGMRQYRWVPSQVLPAFSRLFTEEVRYRIERLLKFKLIKKTTSPYEGYKLSFDGYDALGVGTLTRRGLSAIGDAIGVGKESVVYEGIYEHEPVILKFHRAGYTSFKHVVRKRDTGERDHWIFIAKRAAERESYALTRLQDVVNVPRLIDHTRNLIVMSIAPGRELSKTRVDDPEWFLNEIIDQIRNLYSAGFVHSDLSEYNIFVIPDGLNSSIGQDMSPSRSLMQNFCLRGTLKIYYRFSIGDMI